MLTAIALGALEIVLRATFSRKERIKNFLLPKIIFCKKEWPYDRDTERDLRAAYVAAISVIIFLVQHAKF